MALPMCLPGASFGIATAVCIQETLALRLCPHGLLTCHWGSLTLSHCDIVLFMIAVMSSISTQCTSVDGSLESFSIVCVGEGWHGYVSCAVLGGAASWNANPSPSCPSIDATAQVHYITSHSMFC